MHFLFFILGFFIVFTKQLNNNRGLNVDLSENYLYLVLGGGLIIFSLYLFYLEFKSTKSKSISNKETEFSKCPKCKETFTYINLQKGKCPNCKEIDTIEIEEYYKKYPNEIDE